VNQAAARLADRLRVSIRPSDFACFVALPALVYGYTAWWVLQAGVRERDFRIFRTAAVAVANGQSPYQPVVPAVLAHFDKFVYPPISAVLFLPFAALPLGAGELVMFLLAIASVLLALHWLDVSDWRCYGLALLSTPVLNSILLGAITSLLFLGTAAAWRYRERPAVSGSLAAVVAVAKLFLWPLALWFAATRRPRHLAVFAVVAALTTFGSWAAIGFAGLRSYPHLLRVLSTVEEARGYGLVSLLGVSGTSAEFLTFCLAVLLLVGMLAVGRGRDADRRTFVIAVTGALLVTPLLWLHYFALLFVPIALYYPRLSAAWFLPLGFWLTPVTQPQGSTWRISVALMLAAAVVVSTVGNRRLGRYAPLRLGSTGAG